MAKRNRLSLFQVGAGCIFVLATWVLFWLPLFTLLTILWLLVAVPVALLIVWLISRYVWQPSITAKFNLQALFWAVTILLIVVAPLSLYLVVTNMSTAVIRDIGLDAEVIEQNVLLWDEISDVGDVRKIRTRYRLFEPMSTAEEKLEIWGNAQNPPWNVVWPPDMRRTSDKVRTVIYVNCSPFDRISNAGIHYATIFEDNTLDLMIRYNAYPEACGLPPLLPWFSHSMTE